MSAGMFGVRKQEMKIVTNSRRQVCCNSLWTMTNQAVATYKLKRLRISSFWRTEGKCWQSWRIKKKNNLSIVYVLYIKWFKLLRFNWILKWLWQLRNPKTKQKIQRSLIFLLGHMPSFIMTRRWPVWVTCWITLKRRLLTV